MMLGPRDALDDAADFAEHDAIASVDRLAGMAVRIDCGEQDPFDGDATHLRAAMPEPSSVDYGRGGHYYDFFHKVAPAEVRFIGGRCGAARALGPAARPRAGSYDW